MLANGAPTALRMGLPNFKFPLALILQPVSNIFRCKSKLCVSLHKIETKSASTHHVSTDIPTFRVALGADASTCFVFAPAAQSCCPDDAGDIFSCDFCSNGVEFPDVDPFTSGQTCQDYADTYVILGNVTGCF